MIRTRFTSSRRLAAVAGAAIALLAGAGAAKADALAQALLDINNFRFTAPAAGVSVSVAPGLSLNAAATFQNVAGAPVTVLAPSGFEGTSQSVAGPNAAAFTPGTAITGTPIPNANYAGGFASTFGNPLVAPGVNARTDAVVSLVPAGAPLNSSLSGNTVTQQFDVTVTSAGAAFGVDFSATQFLRAYLDAGAGIFQGGNAQAKTTWRLSISQQQAGGSFLNIADWNPNDGSVNAGLNCKNAAITCVLAGADAPFAAFDLNPIIDAFTNPENQITGPRTGNFGINFDLTQGTYRFQITHESQVSAFLRVPEPGTLALVGLALTGLGLASRRRRTV